MKKLKQIAAVLAVTISMFICVDDVLFLCLTIDSVEIPMHSDSSDITHQHHFSLTDHFCDKNSGADPGPEVAPADQSLLKHKPLADLFLSSIWQPPQGNQLFS
jgi:hypothetical protein